VVVGPSCERAVTEELPEYLAERPKRHKPDTVRLRDFLTSTVDGVRTHAIGARPGFRPGMGPYEMRRDREFSARFLRLVELPARQLDEMLNEWWHGADDGRTGKTRIVVPRRLQLGAPSADSFGGWTMRGRMRRRTSLHWFPVVVEMWPHLDEWTMVTMTPQSRVVRSGRYFRTGNGALDRLTAALSATVACRTRS
jgi:hypothetical protein